MEFQKIQVTKQGTLNVTYKNEDGDIIDFKGANIIHKDLREAMAALTPHLALITEQREANGKTLYVLREQRITDNEDNIYKRLNVESLSFSNGEQRVSITGNRILTKAGVISLTTPNVGLEDDEQYEYNNDIALDIDAVKYEAKAYIEERKWGVKEASLDFRDVDPFKAEAGDVPDAGQQAPKKRGRKSKNAA
jgi:hypothetical protein